MATVKVLLAFEVQEIPILVHSRFGLVLLLIMALRMAKAEQSC